MAVKKSSPTASKKTEAAQKKKVTPIKKAAPAKPAAESKKQEKSQHGQPVDMNSAFYVRKEDNKHTHWRVIDAKGQVLGRMATTIADILRGKDKPYFTPHSDAGDYVIVINASQVVLTGNKMNDKEYAHYTGYIGGLKVTSAKELLAKHPDRIITLAVKGMLPKNILSRYLLRKLRVYPGSEHPHLAHKPEEYKKA
jgi:large subunit ribosomal protein L13